MRFVGRFATNLAPPTAKAPNPRIKHNALHVVEQVRIVPQASAAFEQESHADARNVQDGRSATPPRAQVRRAECKTHLADSSILFACPLRHDTTLQHYPLPKGTPNGTDQK